VSLESGKIAVLDVAINCSTNPFGEACTPGLSRGRRQPKQLA
jgi:hypothetical protein